ncbi:hypothetical protein AQJ91_00085 [Streptomyces dysideae]|uniref:Uncharacterized protein n=1 Tax=Streptomyces dysideae TaxID=909626 RepID=A0A101V644_9ACTN|nr:hypothetical protein AQJ91_00085 [Streptomyces dysideae]
MGWGEAARMMVGCSAVCALAWAVLALLGEPQLPVTAPVVMFLGQWFWTRHRHWGAGAMAVLTGSPVVFVLVDRLRPHLDRLLADAVATEAGVLRVADRAAAPDRRVNGRRSGAGGAVSQVAVGLARGWSA